MRSGKENLTPMAALSQLSPRQALWGGLFLVVLMSCILTAMGQPWWCKCGAVYLWTSDSVSSHNSQHLGDPYSWSHFQHGLGLYLLLWFLLRHRCSLASRGLLAVGLEAVWEIFENTPFTIERYRSATISLDYYGDSVWNSLGDLASCVLGFVCAATVPVWAAVAGYLAIELAMLWFIKDSLLLNVLMLIYPVEAVKNWQQG